MFFMDKKQEDECVNALKKITFNGCKKKSKKNTSSKKNKYLGPEDFEKIASNMSDNSKYGALALLWLEATVITGLRPVEWRDAYIENDVLIVKNAKNTNNRSYDDWRHLTLYDLGQSDKEKVYSFVKKLSNFMMENEFDKIYKSVRDRLYITSKKIWGENAAPSLYSARHQFVANCKKAEMSYAEIAVAMGHKSDGTSKKKYAKARRGIAGVGRVGIRDEDKEKIHITEDYFERLKGKNPRLNHDNT